MLRKPIVLSFIIFTVANFQIISGYAQAQMWNPAELSNYQQVLDKEGLSIPVQKLYDEGHNSQSLNNAIVLFGGGCTGSFISSSGLLLTNHHCGYGYAQKLSTPENNFFTDGFWAKNKSEERPCPGLTVTITRKFVDVTAYLTDGFAPNTSPDLREKVLKDKIQSLEKVYSQQTGKEAKVKSYYGGNQYWVVISEVFRDVRMVSFPPNGIGKFGGDIDNWEWPRMTGDFSIFRVYADKNNQPADYSPQNQPYHPDAFLPVATSGYKEGDFDMVFGYPYLTEEYLTSHELKRVSEVMYPIRVDLRARKLAIWDSAMASDPNIFLKYAAKQSRVANGYKKWKGALLGLEENKVINLKEVQELRFQGQAIHDTDSTAKMILPKLQAIASGNMNTLTASEMTREAVFGVEMISEARLLNDIIEIYRSDTTDQAKLEELKDVDKKLQDFYKDYEPKVDVRVFEALMPVYMKAGKNVVAPGMNHERYVNGNQYNLWAGAVISEGLLANQTIMADFLSHINPSDTFKIKSDPAYKIYTLVSNYQKTEISPKMEHYQMLRDDLHRQYLGKQLQYDPNNDEFYPDANQTLRLATGHIKGMERGAVTSWQTNLNDLMKRDDPSVPQLVIPARLKELNNKRDFGRWAVNGTVPVNFLTTAHTTGGNSGSPVLNAKGQLIGLNFDRPWQSTMSDFYYSNKFCRNIAVDIRYVLFLIDKYGDQQQLIKELKLVK